MDIGEIQKEIIIEPITEPHKQPAEEPLLPSVIKEPLSS